MTDDKKTDQNSEELRESQLEEATGGAIRTIDAYQLTDRTALSSALTAKSLQSILTRFRGRDLLATNRLRPFDRGILIDIPTTN